MSNQSSKPETDNILLKDFVQMSGSQTLKAPEEPKKPSQWQQAPTIACAGLCLVALGVLFAQGPTVDTVVIVALFGCAVLMLALTIFFWMDGDDKIKDATAQWEKNWLPAWMNAVRIWNRIEYSFGDKLLHDPETGESCQPSELNNLLYPEPKE